MIEFFLGFLFAMVLGIVAEWGLEDRRDLKVHELARENRQFREALRYLRDVSPRSPVTRAYIDRVLDDEAGS